MDLKLLWVIQLAPLAAFVLVQLLPKSIKKSAPIIGVLGAFMAASLSSILLLRHIHGEGLPVQFVTPWLHVSDHALWLKAPKQDYTLVVGFLMDPLNLLMIWLVTVISFFIQVFSVYYMDEDSSRARYFGFLSFFSFSMTGLVLSNNLLQTFLFWELVGLTSYLLIGFWFEKPSAANAARKAFMMNRLGDLGFYLGIILLFLLFGTLNFVDFKAEALRQAFSPGLLTCFGLLVFTGIMGKSAQFPFHTWLPDAMEGPTPVSALIHSATMVAAGVFLLTRAFGLFSASATTLWVILIIGSLTAFTGAALATVQRDIKKIMAYSTISQLGFMVMAIGAGSSIAGMFHLSTHAFFKSLLFLTAGSFIHHFHSNDIWEIGKAGGKKHTLAMGVLILGLASLCGVPPFSGFFSKDMILEVLKERSFFFYSVAIFVSLLTVYYSCRLLFVILFSKITPIKHGTHDHDPSLVLKISEALPLLSLAAISLGIGFLGSPFCGAGGIPPLLYWLGAHEIVHLNIELLVTTLGLIAVGGGTAFFLFRDPEKALVKLDSEKSLLKTALERKFFIDDAYQFLGERIGLGIAWILNWFDRTVINGLMVNQTATGVMRLGKLTSKLQDGQLQDYISVALGAGALIAFYLIR
ncbi:MAG: hypothetical protein AUJ72_00425 [Candidatus Omnitrophica bacterium CG1_02_46_14]|nr:MAG: hypothetical protein AUJ72_00425 [Candidatus Omnitrophica bacterium CG1_02_46_14]